MLSKWITSIGLLFVSTQALAIECPATFGSDDYYENVVAAIRSATSCRDGAELAAACALGSSFDPNITVVAERKCGLDFWQKLSAAEKTHYNHLQTKCDNKYKDMQGTMYISANAFCKLRIAELYSDLYLPAE